MKIKNQLLLTHGLLVFLALLIVLINIAAYKNMESDANIVNQTGKLRMLSYNMAQLSNRISTNDSVLKTNNLTNNLKDRIAEFDNILNILSDESTHSDSIVNHEPTLIRLNSIEKKWKEVLRPSYYDVLSGDFTHNSQNRINLEIDSYVAEINEMVNSYSEHSKEKIIKSLIINGILVLVLTAVAFYSFVSTNNRIKKPMQILMEELKALSLVDEEVSKRLKGLKTDEISEMTEYFNEMMYDQLTKTFNRRAGLSKLSRLMQYDNRKNLKLSLCFIDINGLKEVNDNLGHKYGDELIISTVLGIKTEIRENDFIIRMGGDEFLIVFNDTDDEMAEKVWERIRQRYEFINNNEKRSYAISVSHGIVSIEDYQIPELESLIKNADAKMYIEKRHIKEELKTKTLR